MKYFMVVKFATKKVVTASVHCSSELSTNCNTEYEKMELDAVVTVKCLTKEKTLKEYNGTVIYKSLSRPECASVLETYLKTGVVPEKPGEGKRPLIRREWSDDSSSGGEDHEIMRRKPTKNIKSKKVCRNLGNEKAAKDILEKLNSLRDSEEEESSSQALSREQLLEENRVLRREVGKYKKQRDEAYESLDLLRRLERIMQSRGSRELKCSTSSGGDAEEETKTEPMHPHLRHTRGGENVKLVNDVEVYVRKHPYSMFARSCTSSTALARNLLEEVFTWDALKSCSVKGHSSNGLVKAGRREPLCASGVAAIIAFVHNKDTTNGRPLTKTTDIISAMGRRLNEVRKLASFTGAADPTATEEPAVQEDEDNC